MSKNKILTGGLGFIWINLIELLLKKYKVLNIDKITYSSNFYNTKILICLKIINLLSVIFVTKR